MSSESPLFLAPKEEPEAKPSPPVQHAPGASAEPTCRYFVSIQQPECGKPAPHRIQVPLGKGRGWLALCDEHKAVHDANNAARRAAHRAVRDADSH